MNTKTIGGVLVLGLVIGLWTYGNATNGEVDRHRVVLAENVPCPLEVPGENFIPFSSSDYPKLLKVGDYNELNILAYMEDSEGGGGSDHIEYFFSNVPVDFSHSTARTVSGDVAVRTTPYQCIISEFGTSCDSRAELPEVLSLIPVAGVYLNLNLEGCPNGDSYSIELFLKK